MGPRRRSWVAWAPLVQFFAANAQAIHQIENEANLAIPALEAKYGVKFGDAGHRPG